MNRTHLARGLCLGTACSLLLALYACANGDGGRIVVVEAEGDASSTADGATVVVDDSDGGVPVSEDDSAAPCNGSIVINEIQSEGEEFVELFNSGSCDVQLNGYLLEYSSGSGNSPTEFMDLGGSTIRGGDFLVIGCPSFKGTSDLDATSGLGADGQLGLKKGGSTIDEVGWGSISKKVFVEGTAATKPTTSKSIGRVPDGDDTDNNKDDFQQNSPSPGAAN